MSALVFGDVHGKQEMVEKVLALYDVEENTDIERIIFLGDYFDSMGDTPRITREAAIWLWDYSERVINRKTTFLWGNHDLPYAFPAALCIQNKALGYTQAKAKEIRQVLGVYGKERWKVWGNMQLATEYGGWLMTHAGITEQHFARLPMASDYDEEDWAEFLNSQWLQQTRYLEVGSPPSPWLFGIGKKRGGEEETGGILWADWEELCEWHISGIRQIVGHTPRTTVEATPILHLVKLDTYQGLGYAIVDSDGTVHPHTMHYPI